MKVEITKEAFRALVPPELPSINVKSLESAYVIEWESHGVLVIKIENFATCVTQYYVQDINA